MKKIPTLFKRENSLPNNPVKSEITPGCEWVLEGEGTATHKWDGTCCLSKEGVLYKRYDAKQGKTPPDGFIPVQDPDPITGHWPGWLQVTSAAEDKYFMQGWHNSYATLGNPIPEGTYELIGPKVNSNKDGVQEHILIAQDMKRHLVYLSIRPQEGKYSLRWQLSCVHILKGRSGGGLKLYTRNMAPEHSLHMPANWATPC